MMNKVVFQVGILAFFVSLVVFNARSESIIEMVSSSFIIFVGVIAISVVVVAGVSMFRAIDDGGEIEAVLPAADPKRESEHGVTT